jgi:hypothetical protein
VKLMGQTSSVIPAYGGPSTATGVVVDRSDVGTTTVTVPDGRVPRALRTAVLGESALSGVAWAGTGMACAAVLIVALLRPSSLTPENRLMIGGLFAFFSCVLLGGVTYGTYQVRIAILADAWRDRTTFEVDPDGRLDVRVTGPEVEQVFRVPTGAAHRVQVWRPTLPAAATGMAAPPLLIVHRSDGGRSLKLLSGRHLHEIEAAAAALAAALGLPEPDRTNCGRWAVALLGKVGSSGTRTGP